MYNNYLISSEDSNIEKRSTTIESITIEKYYSKEVSRVELLYLNV